MKKKQVKKTAGENAVKATQKGLEALVNKPHPKQIDYREVTCKGLVFRVGPRGAVWNYFRRVDGRLYRMKLGNWPTMSIKAAKERVGDLEQAIEDGKHPQAEQSRQREKKRANREKDKQLIVDNVVKAWRDHHFGDLSPRTRRDYQGPLSEFQASFGDRLVTSIKRGELVRHLDEVKARSPAQANRAASIIRQMFAYVCDRHDIAINPAGELKTPAAPRKRKRVLSRDEIRILWRACELATYPYGEALRFALCTGQRIGEIGAMKWNDIEGRYWSNTENKTDQRIDIFLAKRANEIIKSCPKIGDYVFTATGKRGIRSDTWSGALARHIRPKIALAAQELDLEPISEHWTAHDLRRTVRTGLTGWAKVSPDTAERVLNHSITGIRGNYDFADYKPHVTEALQKWDQELSRILAGKAAAVVPFRRERA